MEQVQRQRAQWAEGRTSVVFTKMEKYIAGKPTELGELIPLILCEVVAMKILLFPFRGEKRVLTVNISAEQKITMLFYHTHNDNSNA